jgi:hypothetical protein
MQHMFKFTSMVQLPGRLVQMGGLPLHVEVHPDRPPQTSLGVQRVCGSVRSMYTVLLA